MSPDDDPALPQPTRAQIPTAFETVKDGGVVPCTAARQKSTASDTAQDSEPQSNAASRRTSANG